MKTQIEQILQAEQDAKGRVAAAEQKAREIAAAAAAEAARTAAGFRDAAKAQVQELLQHTREEAEREKRLVIERARAEAAEIAGREWTGGASRIDEAVRSLAGLP